jgi:tRNA A-37 threonylcarbamoyl transferase component Bud32
MTDLIGQSLGPYTITERIGGGGMADVYKAFHTGLSVYRAVKVIRPELSGTEHFRVRFQKEARSVAALRHPNIVQMHDFGAHGDSYYMVMEFVEGQDLKKVLRTRGRLRPVKEAIDLVAQVANALEYAHERGLIHRDIKPENIMITESGQPILTDFGIAKLMIGGTQLTQTGASIGTPAYMAPEQALGAVEIGPSADIYALTIVLFELLTGRTPFEADTPVAAILKTISDPLPTPRGLAPDIGEALQGVIIKGAAKQATDRFASVGALRDALIAAAHRDAQVTESRTRMAAPTVLSERAGFPRATRRPLLIAAGAAAVAVGAGAAIWSLSPGGGDGGAVTTAAQHQPPITQVASTPDASDATIAAASTPTQAPERESTRAPEESAGSATPVPTPLVDKPAQIGRAGNSEADHVANAGDALNFASGQPGDGASVSTSAAESQPTQTRQTANSGVLVPTNSVTTAAPLQGPASSHGVDQVRKGETTQGDLIRLFGGPNLTTFDEAGRETWIYERTQTQTDVRTSSQTSQATARLGLFFGSDGAGDAAGQASAKDTVTTTTSAVRSMTVIVKFAPDRTVYDYTIRETYF